MNQVSRLTALREHFVRGGDWAMVREIDAQLQRQGYIVVPVEQEAITPVEHAVTKRKK